MGFISLTPQIAMARMRSGFGTVKTELNLDPLANRAAKENLEAGDDGVQIQDLRPENLFPAEGEQLVREGRRAAASEDRLLEIETARIPGIELIQSELVESDDRGEQVIEVMRDARGQVADRVHLLSLPDVLLENHPFRDVLDDLHEMRPVAVRVAIRAQRDTRPDVLAIAASPISARPGRTGHR